MFFINHSEIKEESAAIVELEGPLNSETSSDFEDYIKKLIENGFIYLLLDMYKMDFISSEGIGAILLVSRRIKESSGVGVFFNLNGEVSSLFDILGFKKIFNIAVNEAEAMTLMRDIKRNGEKTPATEPSPSTTEHKGMTLSHQTVSAMDLDFDDSVDNSLPEKPRDFFFDEDIAIEEDLEPFVIECLKCGSLVRIKEKGDHICPVCKTEFSVADEGRAVFKIDEITS